MNLKNQRRMAASILGCGENRVWISRDPKFEEYLDGAITRGDVRKLIAFNVVQMRPARGISRGRFHYAQSQRAKGRRGGQGSRKGAKKARNPKKARWIRVVRPLRARLAQLRAEGRLDPATYRTFYARTKGGMFKNKAHLEQALRSSGALKGAK